MAPIHERTHFIVRGLPSGSGNDLGIDAGFSGRGNHHRNHHYIFTYAEGQRIAIAGPGSKSDMRNKLPAKRRRYPDASIRFLDVGERYWIRSKKKQGVPLEGRSHQHNEDGTPDW